MNDLERLRTLLLEQEQQRLNRLEAQQQTAARQQQLSDDLPDVVAGLGDSPAFRASLSQPVTAALHESIKRDRDSVASLLFPVIGPAIRRAVQESLRSVLQRINLALEYGLSPRAWRWRLQAWRSGESFAQIVLRNSLAFSVDEIFIIHRDSGLVVARRSRREVLALDQDAVASMLTAIQNFLRQSLAGVADDPLRTVELGSATLWLVNGPQALLAAVIRGEPPITLRDNLQEALERAHTLLGETLSEYSGDALRNPTLDHELDQQLVEQIPPARNRGPVRLVWLTVFLALVAALSWWSWHRWQLHSAMTALQNVVTQTPGVILIDARIRGDQVHAQVLRDPLAPPLAELLHDQPEDQFVIREQAYLAQESDFILQRLRLAAGITADQPFTLEPASSAAGASQTLHTQVPLTPQQWRSVLASAAIFAPQWQLPQPPLDQSSVQDALELPAGLNLTVNGDQLTISGTAPASWHQDLPRRLAALKVRFATDLSQLQAVDSPPPTVPEPAPSEPDPATELHQLIASVNGTRLNFTQGVQLEQTSRAGLNSLATRIITMDRLARDLEQAVTVVLIGMSDGVDSWDVNIKLRQRRAETVAAELIAAGVSSTLLQIAAADTPAPDGFDAGLRYTEVLVRTE